MLLLLCQVKETGPYTYVNPGYWYQLEGGGAYGFFTEGRSNPRAGRGGKKILTKETI